MKELFQRWTDNLPLARNKLKERQSKQPCRFQCELEGIHSCNEGKVFSNPICLSLPKENPSESSKQSDSSVCQKTTLS